MLEQQEHERVVSIYFRLGQMRVKLNDLILDIDSVRTVLYKEIVDGEKI